MMVATEMIGVRTNEKIEFNPQENLLGKTVGRPWSPPRHGGYPDGRFMRAVRA